MRLRNVPTRLATGLYIGHAGWEMWRGNEQQAAGVHGMASATYPFLKNIPAPTFLKLVAVGELGVAATLLTPWVPNRIAGAALSSFAVSVLGLYVRTPGQRRAGSVWPEPAGIALSKDVWMLGVGLGLLADHGPSSAEEESGPPTKG